MKEKEYLCDLVQSGRKSKFSKISNVIVFAIGAIAFLFSFIFIDTYLKVNYYKELSSYSDYEKVYEDYDKISEMVKSSHRLELSSLPKSVKYEVFYEEDKICLKVCPILSTFDAEATYIYSSESFDLISVHKKYGNLKEYSRSLKIYNFLSSIILSFLCSCIIIFVLYLVFCFLVICSYIKKRHNMKKL